MGSYNFSYKDKTYEVDSRGFLLDFENWDENYAEGMGVELRITQGLTKEHWDVIYSIRSAFKEMGRRPLVYEICKLCSLLIADLERLFPTGYMRGACKLAGVSPSMGGLGIPHYPLSDSDIGAYMAASNKVYEVDVRGFLMKPDQWDDYFAMQRAHEMKIAEGELTEKHWQIIRYLRDYYKKNKTVPTVYETCKENQVEIDELERLFPDGYHRGAVKIAGLRFD